VPHEVKVAKSSVGQFALVGLGLGGVTGTVAGTLLWTTATMPALTLGSPGLMSSLMVAASSGLAAATNGLAAASVGVALRATMVGAAAGGLVALRGELAASPRRVAEKRPGREPLGCAAIE